jgi:hypothetical protein
MALLDNTQRIIIQRNVASGNLSIAEALSLHATYARAQTRT